MTNINRRELVGLGAAGAVGLAAGIPLAKTIADRQIAPAGAAVTPVVVVGGGMAGVSVAKYIRLWSNKTIPVILLEANASYSSNIMSNLVLTGQKTMSNLNYSYSKLASTHGVQVITGAMVTAVTPGTPPSTLGGAAGTVTYRKSGQDYSLAYSRLVVAPGIDFLPFAMTGTAANQAKVVHAWTAASPAAGAQMTSLRNQLVAMPTGGVFVMTIPPAPYRCPPGPYERACLVADWIKKNRRDPSKFQVIVLDANPGITAEAVNFNKAFTDPTIHGGVIQYIPSASLISVNADTGDVVTSAGTFRGNVINVIPKHTAGAIARNAGLAAAPDLTVYDPTKPGFCPVNVLTYESTLKPYVHVLGDASMTTQPKAGHIANQEAKVCADAIVRLLNPLDATDWTARALNVTTNSSCYSPITMTTASWLAVVFKYDTVNKKMVVAGPAGKAEEAPAITTGNFSQMNTWFSVLMQDTFA